MAMIRLMVEWAQTGCLAVVTGILPLTAVPRLALWPGMNGWTNFGDAAGDTFNGVESIYATNFSDSLGGDNLSNALYGNGGQ